MVCYLIVTIYNDRPSIWSIVLNDGNFIHVYVICLKPSLFILIVTKDLVLLSYFVPFKYCFGKTTEITLLTIFQDP